MPTSKNAAREAREQADAYDSIFAGRKLTLDNGETVDLPPHPNLKLLDDERLQAYEELLFEAESYDRGPDVHFPEHRLLDKDGKETGPLVPAETRRGEVLVPHRRTVDGKVELVKPPFSVRTVIAALGEEKYAQIRKGGRSAADVWALWNRQGLDITDRRRDDSKSDDGIDDLETVSPSDSK